jgi:hypothetical protein
MLLKNSDSKEKSHGLIDKLLEQFHHNLPVTANAGRLGALMISAGYEENGKQLLEDYANQVYNNYIAPKALAGYISKSTAEKLLLEVKASLGEAGMKSDVVDQLVEKFD